MEKKIISVIKYFSFFAYHPTLDEIHTFLQVKISKNELKMELDHLKYTPPQYSIGKEISNIKYKKSKIKLNKWRYKAYIRLLSIFPQIKLVGLSGSISMMNAGKDDDIDLFIITQKERLFTGRFLATIFAYIMRLKRGLNEHKAPNKVCLNLFFDEKNMAVPEFKQTEYVAHEILQMKPIINKNQTYEKFLEVNKWVFRLFPNGKNKSEIRNPKSEIIFKFKNFQNSNLFRVSNFVLRIFSNNWLENLLKNLQLKLINYHRTTEIITSTQLWFHPDDFEKKINANY